MSKAKLKIVMTKREDLVLYDKNPRRTSRVGLQKLIRSIREVGWTQPVLAQAGSKMVIAGHQRLKAAEALEMTEVPVIYLDISDAKAKQYAIADNKLSEDVASWDKVLLADILKELADDGQDISLSGFDMQEAHILMDKYNNEDAMKEIAKRFELDDASAKERPFWIVIRGPHSKYGEVFQNMVGALREQRNDLYIETSEMAGGYDEQ